MSLWTAALLLAGALALIGGAIPLAIGLFTGNDHLAVIGLAWEVIGLVLVKADRP